MSCTSVIDPAGARCDCFGVVCTSQVTNICARETAFMDLALMMEGYGFRFERPVGWLSAPGTGEILQMDALFVRE